MSRLSFAFALLPLVISAPAAATVSIDPIGDFIPSFTGPQTGDLDVSGFSVAYDPGTEIFRIAGSLAAAINPEADYYYVIGVNTGAGAIAPFGSIGEPNVVFDQVVVVGSEGEAFLGDESNALAFTILGSDFTVDVPLSMLPSTGRDPLEYAFNLWPRTDLDPPNLAAISDFAPDNSMIHPTSVPEPATWLMLLFGFGIAGTALRARRAEEIPSQV
jgi:hypothetical protein